MGIGTSRRSDGLKYGDHERLLELLRSGVSRRAAIQAIGFSIDTLRRWMREGEEDIEAERDTHPARLVRRIWAVEAEIEKETLSALVGHAAASRESDWRAHAWILERRHGRNWSLPGAKAASGETGEQNPVSDAVRKMGPKELAECLEAGAALIRGEADAQDEARELDADQDA